MAATSVSQIAANSVEATGVSVATATGDPAYPRRGSVYTAGLKAARPVWFHPLNGGTHLMVMSGHQILSGTTTTTVSVPAWAVVDPATGNQTDLAAVPSAVTGVRQLRAAASRGDYLFLLSQIGVTALIQYFRVTGTGGLVLESEERVPGDLGLGLHVAGNYLWVFGRHSTGTLALARRNWGRIGAGEDKDPAMNWQFRGDRGWSTDVGTLAALDGGIPADGPCAVAALADRYYLVATSHSGTGWSAQGYTSRLPDTGWSRHGFTADLGTDGGGYLGGTVQLQPQLPLSAGYTTTATTGGATVLTSDASRSQVLTGTAGHVLTLPPAITDLAPFSVYNQSTSDVTVTASGGTTVALIERGTGAVLTPTSLTPTAAVSWSRGPTGERSPRARSGFAYVLTRSPDTSSWTTTWDVFEV
jgi:hypothetical protein